jgi:guanine deaminase
VSGPAATPEIGDHDAVLAARAVELATANARAGQLPFGALVARGDRVLGSGVNTALRDHDPLAHAEVEAVRAACRGEGTLQLAGATLYTSCEPCPLCQTAALTAGVRHIVYAAPKELVPDLEGSPAASDLAAIGRVRDALGTAQALDLVHVDIADAGAPFHAYRERRASG